MTRSTTFFAAAALLLASVAMPAFAQGAKQTVSLMEVNPITLATGYRSTKVVGSTVYNEAKEEIGKVDDLIVTSKDSVPYAVLSVGGFLGMGTHNIVVPASALDVVDGRMMLRGASKDSLKALPNYAYTY
ncbi:PRC-barrel domain-containing protein [Bosea sp. R86505]|uniref:PRC-barrel domain-containing protein n=1 Tax=Bosea sp. R86505 TaxID=3101710 RepID=UPI00366D649B